VRRAAELKTLFIIATMVNRVMTEIRRWMGVTALLVEDIVPSLRPANRYAGKVYVGQPRTDHLSVLKTIGDAVAPQYATPDGDTRGYVTERGHSLD
jgi:hypothetical protein